MCPVRPFSLRILSSLQVFSMLSIHCAPAVGPFHEKGGCSSATRALGVYRLPTAPRSKLPEASITLLMIAKSSFRVPEESGRFANNDPGFAVAPHENRVTARKIGKTDNSNRRPIAVRTVNLVIYYFHSYNPASDCIKFLHPAGIRFHR